MDLIVATSSFSTAPGISVWGSVHGETAHAALGLAKGLRGLGHRTTLVAPLDAEVGQSGLGLARRLSPLTFDVAGEAHERIVFDARLPSGVELVLLGGEVPGEAADAREASRRWSWFGHAVAALARQRLGQVRQPGESELEAVVAVGEGASFSAFAIREGAKAAVRDQGPSPRLLAGLSRIVIPIDPARDHRLPREALASIGVAPELFSPEGIEFYGEASLVKAGAVAADRVVSLGEAPRLSLTTAGAPHRLDGVYRARGNDLVSIGSGVDQAQYNPATDPHLVARFDADDLTGKLRGRSSLLAELELEQAASVPLLVVAGAIDKSAETGLVAALTRALRGELLVIVARSSQKAESTELDTALEKLARTHVGRFAVRNGVNEAFLHRAIGSADFALLLDATSATGTPARAAMRYGTVPIAPRTPAMEEAIVDLEASLATGTGILVAGTSGDDIFGGIQRAVSAYSNDAWLKVQRRAMRIEGGWERAARRLASIIAQLEA
jgi:starch synthase